MISVKIPNVVQRNGAYYFQARRYMRQAGIFSEPLGTDLSTAIRRAEELDKAWKDVRAGKDQPHRVTSPAGTMSRFIHDFKISDAYLSKSMARQDELDYTTAIIEKVFGPSQLRSIKPAHCEKFYTALKRKGGNHKAARVMKDLRFLFNRAVNFEVLVRNPALAFQVTQPKSRTQKWTPEQVDIAINTAWDNGYSGIAVAIAIAYDTGLSPVDIRTLTIGQIDGNRLVDVSRAKTGRAVHGKLWDETLQWIATYQDHIGIAAMPTALLIRTRRGRPYTKDILAKDLRDVRRLAGLPEALQMRDLRRTASTEEFEGGATIKEVASARAWSGKTAAKMSDIYAPGNFEMAKGAHDKRPKNLKGPKGV